jgi:hypothetical protein
MIDTIIGFVVGFVICAVLVSDWVPIYEENNIKTIHQKGHFYRLVEVDRNKAMP